MPPTTTTRTERDTMGEMQVPADAYYGASTQRAVLNFPISGLRMPRRFVRALGLIKQAAAEVNRELGKLKPELAHAIARAAGEVAEEARRRVRGGRLPDRLGTSTNMNANEVIANRAAELLGSPRGSRGPCTPTTTSTTGSPATT
jgi:fumarate hydratase class II